MAQKAKFDLDEVKELIRARSVYVLNDRAIALVIKVYADTDQPKSRDDAETFIIDGLLNLESIAFCERKWMSEWEQVVDIYGKVIDDYPWFIKFYIEYEEDGSAGESKACLCNVSFHPPDRDITLANGKCIEKGIEYENT